MQILNHMKVAIAKLQVISELYPKQITPCPYILHMLYKINKQSVAIPQCLNSGAYNLK